MKIFITEDNKILLKNLTFLLSGEKSMEVIGTATSAEECLKSIENLEVDILITDLGLPEMQGIDLISEVKKIYPNILIIANTIYEDNATVFQAIRNGASGYMLKGSTPREFIEAIEALHLGGAPMSPSIAKKVILEFQKYSFDESSLLSSREIEILKLIENGLSYSECATKLSISTHTVNSHIKKIYQKLHATNKQEAVLKAKQKGIL